MSLVSNERIKLTAGLLNTVAGFALTAGGVGPLIALSFGLSASSPLSTLALTAPHCHLVERRVSVSFGCAAAAREAEVVNASQFIAIVVAPLSLLVVGFGIFLWSNYADR